MAVIRPFRALRPEKSKAEEVSSSSFEGDRESAARELKKHPESYLNVVKPYLHFPGEAKNPEKHFPLGLKYLQDFLDRKILIRDKESCFYIYRLIKGSKAYTSIIASAAVDNYLDNTILKHENTRTDKQNELLEHISYIKNIGSPVLLTYPDNKEIDSLIDKIIGNKPEYNFISADQLKHNLWVVKEADCIDLIKKEFAKMQHLYIADGHHRSAGAAAYCIERRKENPDFSGVESFNFFPVALIPFSKLYIYEFHRLIRDPSIVNDPLLLEKIGKYFHLSPQGHLPFQPLRRHEFGIYFNHTAYMIRLKDEYKPQPSDILSNLDVSIIEQFILKNIFNVNDSKTDHRLSFMEGSKGIGHLQNVVDKGDYDFAITLYPTSIDEVKAVAENNLIMPPKSTWIEPKIRTGLIIYSED